MQPLSEWQRANLAKLVKKHGMGNVMIALFQIASGQLDYWRGYTSVKQDFDGAKVKAWEKTAERIAICNNGPWTSDE